MMKRKNTVNRKKISVCFILISVIVLFTLIIIVPIIINELYKLNVGYYTVWNADDVLSYYGTLLGSAATIVALIGTILFTRKQIKSEQFLHENLTKLEKVEGIITRAITEISPLNMCKQDRITGKSYEEINMVLLELNAYSINGLKALDSVKLYVNLNDNNKLLELYKEISDRITVYQGIETKLREQYMELKTKFPKTATPYPRSTFASITEEITKICDNEIMPAYTNSYLPLIDKKREIFDEIYQSVYEKANDIFSVNIYKK